MEKKQLYVIFAEIYGEDGNSSDVLGVFEDKNEALRIAKAEIDERYACDLRDSYESKPELLAFEQTVCGWRYHSEYDYYEVEVSVFTKTLNEKDVNLRCM